MTVTVVAILFIVAFLSSFVQRVSGFGFGIVFVSVAPFFMPSHGEATALSGMLAIVCAFYTGIQFFRYVNWRKLYIILSTFLLVSFGAVCMVARLDAHLLRDALGVVLVLVCLYFLFMNGRISMKASAPVQLSMGVLSGLMGGFFGMQGPPAVLYFISSTDDKKEYMALTQWYFIIGNLFMTFYRAGNGFVTVSVIKLFAICIPAIVLGLLLGSRVYGIMPIEKLRKVVYVFIGVAGILAIIF